MAFGEALAVMKKRYRAKTDVELREIFALTHQPLTPTAICCLRDITHKIHGSAGTFGFPALGCAAERVERLCNHPKLLDERWTNALHLALQELEVVWKKLA